MEMGHASIKARIRQHLAEKLKVSPEDIADDQPFEQLGIDSITAIELTFELETETGKYTSPGLLFEYNTVKKLAGFLVQSD